MRRFISLAGAWCIVWSASWAIAAEPKPQAGDVSLQFLRASLRVAEQELKLNQSAREKVPGSVSDIELERLALNVEKARAQLAMAEAKLAAELPQSAAKETESLIRKALDEKTEFHFVEKPLYEVADAIAKKHNIQIVLNKKALDDAGIGSDTPITWKLKNISLRSALHLSLRDLDMTWVIADEVLQLTTVDDAGQMLVPVVYDVTDLVAAEGGADFDTLIDLLTSIIDPSTWDQVGGPGSIAPYPLDPAQVIVISQTHETHERVAKFLSDLRAVRVARGAKPEQKAAVEPADPNAVVVKVYKIPVPLRVAAVPKSGEAAESKPKESLPQVAFGQGTPNDRYLDELSRAIPALVRPESWERAGGHGVLFALPAESLGNGHLLVRQTAEVHAQLQRFLNELQSKGAGQGGFGGGGGLL